MKKRIFLSFISFISFFCAIFVCCETLRADLPKDAQVLEAENFQVSGDGWRCVEHKKDAWYSGFPSAGKYLSGCWKSESPALNPSQSLQLKTSGTHFLWVRSLDMTDYRDKNSFRVTGIQNNQSIFEEELDSASLRTTPEGKKKWGDGFSCWVWSKITFEAKAGTVNLELSKVFPEASVHTFGRAADVMILTDDAAYEPQITDLTPLFVKVRVLSGQPYPIGIHVFGKRDSAPYYSEHSNIVRSGLEKGIQTGMQAENLLAPGDESEWVNLAPFLAYGGSNHEIFYAMRSYYESEPQAFFEILFSKTPSEEGLLKTVTRKGAGNGVFVSVSLVNYDVESELEGSLANRKRSEEAGEVSGKKPIKFPFLTGMALSSEQNTREALQNETQALQNVGLSGIWKQPANFFFHLTKVPGCYSVPDAERIEASFAQSAEKFRKEQNETGGEETDFSHVFCLNMMDEPGLQFEHLAGCETCKAGFRPYLRSLGLPQSEADALELSNDPNVETLVGKRSFYYTRRYLNHILTEMLRAGTTAAGKSWKNVPTTVNFATELLGGNMVKRGLDWFEIFDSGALTYGWSEDWAGWMRTKRTNGFMCDTLRSACGKTQREWGFYDVTRNSTEWETEASGFLEIGHGARALRFFNYGPHYAISSDTTSSRPEIYRAMKRLTYATGAAEDAILLSRPAQGDAAMLLSVTSDIWNVTNDNLYGTERMALHLLLAQNGILCNILSEEALSAELGRYDVLFVTDSHLRKEFVPIIEKWVKNGGILYVSPNALTFDEFDQPLGLYEKLGVTRGEFQFRQFPGRPEYEMRTLKSLGEFEGIPIVCAQQGEPFAVKKVEKGKLLLVGFFPGISSLGSAENVLDDATQEAIPSVLKFPEAPRDFMKKVWAETGRTQRISCSNSDVEVRFLESPKEDVLAISNWTGREQTVQIVLNTQTPYLSARSITGTLTNWECSEGKCKFELTLKAGDYVLLKKK